jgi:hypothetical protein
MNILVLCSISSCFVMFLHPAVVDGEQGGWGVARGGEEAGAPGGAGQLQGGQLSSPHRHLHQAHPGQSSGGGGGILTCLLFTLAAFRIQSPEAKSKVHVWGIKSTLA